MNQLSIKSDRKDLVKDLGLLVIFVLVLAILAIVQPAFRRPMNLINVLRQASITGILSFGMMKVIISGGIDLSMGSVLGLSGVCAAMFAAPGAYPIIVPVIVALVVGGLCGAFNGIGVTYGGLPPFIITLGTMSVARGLALVLSGGVPIYDVSTEFGDIVRGTFIGIPLLVWYFIIVVAISAFILNKTIFGRRIYGIGGNIEAAKVSGINVKRTLIGIYTFAGLTSGLAGLLMAARTSQGAPTAGLTYEMDAVTAVVIGGVSMSGGVGKCQGVLIGALFIAVIENGLTIFGVDPNMKQIVKGAIIIAAVLLDVKTKGNQN